MLGAIIGDIVGSRFEFNNIHSKHFELFASDCGFTDDTICTCAVADAALHGTPYRTALLGWCRCYPAPMGGYGGSFVRWLNSNDPQPYGSYGNGSAMRVSAIGWLYPTLDDVLLQARLSAEPTHNHPEGIKGAQAVAAAIFLLKGGAGKREVAAYVEETFGYDLSGSVEWLRAHNVFNETCQVTVPQAFVCFAQSDGFEDAVRNAVSIGGDSDTIGAIAGSLAEAHYGIPADIRRRALGYLDSAMTAVVGEFQSRISPGL